MNDKKTKKIELKSSPNPVPSSQSSRIPHQLIKKPELSNSKARFIYQLVRREIMLIFRQKLERVRDANL